MKYQPNAKPVTRAEIENLIRRAEALIREIRALRKRVEEVRKDIQ